MSYQYRTDWERCNDDRWYPPRCKAPQSNDNQQCLSPFGNDDPFYSGDFDPESAGNQSPSIGFNDGDNDDSSDNSHEVLCHRSFSSLTGLPESTNSADSHSTFDYSGQTVPFPHENHGMNPPLALPPQKRQDISVQIINVVNARPISSEDDYNLGPYSLQCPRNESINSANSVGNGCQTVPPPLQDAHMPQYIIIDLNGYPPFLVNEPTTSAFPESYIGDSQSPSSFTGSPFIFEGDELPTSYEIAEHGETDRFDSPRCSSEHMLETVRFKGKEDVENYQKLVEEEREKEMLKSTDPVSMCVVQQPFPLVLCTRGKNEEPSEKRRKMNNMLFFTVKLKAKRAISRAYIWMEADEDFFNIVSCEVIEAQNDALMCKIFLEANKPSDKKVYTMKFQSEVMFTSGGPAICETPLSEPFVIACHQRYFTELHPKLLKTFCQGNPDSDIKAFNRLQISLYRHLLFNGVDPGKIVLFPSNFGGASFEDLGEFMKLIVERYTIDYWQKGVIWPPCDEQIVKTMMERHRKKGNALLFLGKGDDGIVKKVIYWKNESSHPVETDLPNTKGTKQYFKEHRKTITTMITPDGQLVTTKEAFNL